MSLDALFTEAAEAGGPPRFTEDDIALRVDARRARRRRIVAVGAALVVLGGGAFGLVAANRGGSESPADPIGPPEGGISAIAPTPQVLAGDWSSVPPGRGSFRFQVDGRVEFGNCNRFYGRRFEIGGDLVLGSAGGTEMGCGGADGELDRLLQTAPLTLYEDGLLRVGGHDQVIDFVRDDDA
ncbi:MAG TPA: hypothetical protein VD926_08495, partial [Acidimicrobiales bacterium]|nr:hypothetical protein [Acidimicrobiales bacterium]